MHAEQTLDFALIGGDMRQVAACELLVKSGYRVRTFALNDCILPPEAEKCNNLRDCLFGARCVILPMPLTRDGETVNAPFCISKPKVKDILQLIGPDTSVFGGAIKPEVFDLARKNNMKLIDYMNDEALTIQNAAITAEGAIGIAIMQTPIELCGSKCLVVGNGRIGRILADKLRALGAQTWVSARKREDYARIRAAGHQPLKTHLIDDRIRTFSIVFNTVPAMVLPRPVLEKMNRNATIIDLASQPGGTDFVAARELGIKVEHALSIPGKIAPVTGGEIIVNTVMQILYEEGAL